MYNKWNEMNKRVHDSLIPVIAASFIAALDLSEGLESEFIC